MYDTRYNRDDLIPALADDGIATTLEHWIQRNVSEECLIELTTADHGIILLPRQLRQLLADMLASGRLPDIDNVNLPEAIARPSAPSGIGCAGGNVWVTPPGETYALRFYVNGTFKLAMSDYYITSLESIGAVSGDVVQVCQVVDGVPGWWTRITVT